MSDIRVCASDGEPLVFTFEFPGAEYVCGVCGRTEGVFGGRAPATPERQRRHDELTEQYERARAERAGQTYREPAKAGDAGVVVPTCKGCGATPEPGIALQNGKPASWFSRTIDGGTEYACIPERESVLPW